MIRIRSRLKCFIAIGLSLVFLCLIDLKLNDELPKVLNMIETLKLSKDYKKIDSLSIKNNQIQNSGPTLIAVDQDENELKDGLAKYYSVVLQKRLFQLQNPADCENEKILVCSLKRCGFGCQMHHIVYCLNEALKQNRTFLLTDNEWIYTKNGFEKYFRPLSGTCKNIATNDTLIWKGNSDPVNLKKITIKHMSMRPNKPNFARYFVSSQDHEFIQKFHSHPFIWWIGQTFKFIFRLQPSFKRKLEAAKTELRLRKPIVGIHVRRTDKGSEADFYPLEAYIEKAEQYFQLYKTQNPNVIYEKMIYLATDDANVITEFISNPKFNQYTFKYNKQAAIDAKANRESQNSFEGLLKDMLILADCDYVVCTLSSNICRLVYELLQTKHIDATTRLHSLDSDYFLDFFSPQFETAIHDHSPSVNSNELELKIGDTVHIRFYIPVQLMNTRVRKFIFNGFKNATNMRTNQTGLYPAYKTIE